MRQADPAGDVRAAYARFRCGAGGRHRSQARQRIGEQRRQGAHQRLEYDHGMTTKIAVSLPDEQVAAARRAVDQGRAASVSGFVSDALRETVREDALAALLADMDEELGKVPDDVQRAADEALGLA